jgi:hypothetical protein
LNLLQSLEGYRITLTQVADRGMTAEGKSYLGRKETLAGKHARDEADKYLEREGEILEADVHLKSLVTS